MKDRAGLRLQGRMKDWDVVVRLNDDFYCFISMIGSILIMK